MAPGLVESTAAPAFHITKPQSASTELSINTRYVPGCTVVEDHEIYEHTDLLPCFPKVQWGPLTEVPYHDRGNHGHPHFHNLLASATDVFDYNPTIGTEIHGVDLADLSNAQKDDLARLIASRGVVFFRNQANFDIDAQRKLGRYFGSLHKHATTSVPQAPGLDDVHVVYADERSKDQRAKFAPSFLWHSDVSHLIWLRLWLRLPGYL